MNTKKSTKQSGYLMIEVLVAVTIVSVALVALVAGLTQSLGATKFSAEQSAATRLAQEAVEWLKSWQGEADSWDDYASMVRGNYCWQSSSDGNTGLPLNSMSKPGCNGTNKIYNIFDRRLEVNRDNDTITYTVTVSWGEGAGSNVELTGEIKRNNNDFN